MEKEQILTFIKTQVDSGKVTSAEIMQALAEKPVGEGDASKKIVHAFYGIGMVIAIVGVIILIVQNWNDIGFAGRILVTLGISAVTYLAGMLARGDEHRVLSQVMFTVSAALAPVGVFIILNEANTDITSTTHVMVSLALAILYGAAQFIARRNILTLIIVAFVTWTYFAFFDLMFGFDVDEDVLKWAVIVLGVAYIFLAYGLKQSSGTIQEHKEGKSVTGALSTLGTLAVLGAGITLGGFWDMIYILPLFGSFYASVFLKNSSMLVLGALFLMAHIIKLTSEYFVDSIGWPIALVLCGFLIIGIGYATYQVNKKYIKAV